ncbi:unnamed protein product [Parnassius apollo]|uniref:(apollo) hypothetical protein n=1 Tax=Parnassius apollo TaxID=110799 RepID=A0A8S3XFE8_PARAO|nr:unnamed protein product [Parnassius apollo]
MPLRRTPPSTSKQVASLLQVLESDANQSSAPPTDTDNESSNVNNRNRNRPRKRQYDDELASFMVEMRKSIGILTKQQDTIQESIKDIKKQNTDIKESMDFISKQYEDMKNKLAKMELDRKSHLAHIQSLEQKVENLERSQRQASIEIRNIPINKKESKQDLVQLVKKVGQSVNVCVEELQIRDVFRLKTKKRK